MTKQSDTPAAGTRHHAAQRRDRAQRLHRRITRTVAATGVGTVAAFGVLAANHNAGTAAVAATPAASSASAAATPSASSSGSAANTVPTIAPATAAPTAAAAPTAQAVTGGSGG
jgi:hypothetical protein